jgi:hypothetical protein
LNEPLWLRVTFAATNSTFEFSVVIGSVSAFAGFAAALSGAALPTVAFVLFAADQRTAKVKSATARIDKSKSLILFLV